MAERIENVNAIQFRGSYRASSSLFGTDPVETDETISFSSDGVSVTLVKRPGPNKVSQRTLTQSEIPSARAGKRKHYKRVWRGEELTANSTRAAYSHVDEDGVEHDIKVVHTRSEDWRGTRSPESRRDIVDGDITEEYHDYYWRAV